MHRARVNFSADEGEERTMQTVPTSADARRARLWIAALVALALLVGIAIGASTIGGRRPAPVTTPEISRPTVTPIESK